MKNFFGEYGKVVVSSLVVVLLLSVCIVLKPLAAEGYESVASKLDTYVMDKLESPENSEAAWEMVVVTDDNWPSVMFTSVPEGATWQDAINANLRFSINVPDLDIHSNNTTFVACSDPECSDLVSFVFDDNEDYDYNFILNSEVEYYVIYITVSDEILPNVVYILSAE